MGKKIEFNDEEIYKIKKMYAEDLGSTKSIAKKYKVDSSVIVNTLRKVGINVPNGSAYSVEYWIKRGLNEEEAMNHIKTLRPVNKEYWIKLGYTKEDAILQIEGQKMTSLRGCIARFGLEEGTKIWGERETKRSDCGKLGSANIQYWVNKGFTEREAIEQVKERQSTFSKDKCVAKYGEIDGLKRFTERQIKWQKTLYKNGKLKSGYSEVSQELFFKIVKNVNINELNYILFAKKSGEFVLNDENGFYRYDFTDLKNKKIIEYNGDDYHGNPKKFLSTDFPNPFRKNISAKEIWDKDEKKKIIANKNGFSLLTIWDSEYKKNKLEVITKCIKFLSYDK